MRPVAASIEDSESSDEEEAPSPHSLNESNGPESSQPVEAIESDVVNQTVNETASATPLTSTSSTTSSAAPTEASPDRPVRMTLEEFDRMVNAAREQARHGGVGSSSVGPEIEGKIEEDPIDPEVPIEPWRPGRNVSVPKIDNSSSSTTNNHGLPTNEETMLEDDEEEDNIAETVHQVINRSTDGSLSWAVLLFLAILCSLVGVAYVAEWYYEDELIRHTKDRTQLEESFQLPRNFEDSESPRFRQTRVDIENPQVYVIDRYNQQVARFCIDY